MSEKRAYRIGIIGFGMIGKVHAWAHENLKYYLEDAGFETRIVRVCTAHEETARAAAEFLGTAEPTTDFRAVTEAEDIDIVHICSPNADHARQLLSAMKAGKHVYCDKPLVASREETESIRDALSAYEGIMGVTFQNRFFPAVIMAKHLIEDGFLGDLLSFRAAYLHSGSADPDAPLKWKMTASAGGGVLADLGSHVIDLVSDLAGPIEELVAHRQQAFEQRPDPKDPGSLVDVDAEDDVMLLARVRSKTGLEEKTVAGTIEASKIATGAEDELRFELSGVNGAIRFNSLRPGVLETFDAQGVRVSESELHGWTAFDVNRRFEPPATQFPGKKFAIGWPRSHSACLAAYMKAVHAGTEFHPNAVDGLYVQRVMEACRRSWKSGSFERVLQV